MDKKAAQQAQTLDPKLKEIYERVMGTQVTPPRSVPSAPSSSPATTPPPTPTPTAPAAATGGTTPIQQAPPSALEPTPAATTKVTLPNVAPASPSTSSTTTFVAGPRKEVKTGGGKGIPSLVFVLAGLMFFVIYTLFWLKIFNIPIPFLPQ